MKKNAISYLIAIVLAFSFPAVLIYGGLNYHLNSIYYSGHGGFGLFAGYLCFPWIVFVFVMFVLKKKGKERRERFNIAIITIALYSLLTIPFSYRVAEQLNIVWGLPNDGIMFWAIINFPLSLFVYLFHQ